MKFHNTNLMGQLLAVLFNTDYPLTIIETLRDYIGTATVVSVSEDSIILYSKNNGCFVMTNTPTGWNIEKVKE